MKKVYMFLCVLGILGNSILLNASVIYDQPLDPNSGYGYTANYGQQNIFEDFLIPSVKEVNRVAWWGLFSAGTAATVQSIANFDILFFKTDYSVIVTEPNSGTIISGLPNQTPFYEYHATGIIGTPTGFPDMLHGGDIYRWAAEVPTVLFNEPSKYWIVVRASFNEADFFLWEHSASVEDHIAVHATASEFPMIPYFPYYRGGELIYKDAAAFWSNCVSLEYYNAAQAFTLEYITPVPEPNTMLLLASGLVGLAGLRRKLKNNYTISQ